MAIRLSNRLFYALGVVVILVGAAVDAWFALTYRDRLAAAMQQVTVPGAWEITLPERGTYTVFHEKEAVVRGKKYSVPAVPGLAVELATRDGRIKVPVRPAAPSTYSLDGRSAVSLVEFTINQPGPYLLTGRYPTGRGPEAVLAVGRYADWSVWVRNRMIAIGAVALVVGVGIIAAAFVMGRRASRAEAEPAMEEPEAFEEAAAPDDEIEEQPSRGFGATLARLLRLRRT